MLVAGERQSILIIGTRRIDRKERKGEITARAHTREKNQKKIATRGSIRDRLFKVLLPERRSGEKVLSEGISKLLCFSLFKRGAAWLLVPFPGLRPGWRYWSFVLFRLFNCKSPLFAGVPVGLLFLVVFCCLIAWCLGGFLPVCCFVVFGTSDDRGCIFMASVVLVSTWGVDRSSEGFKIDFLFSCFEMAFLFCFS